VFCHLYGPQQLKPRTVVNRALAEVGQIETYNVQKNNCEHYCSRAKTGTAASVQSDPPLDYTLPRARRRVARIASCEKNKPDFDKAGHAASISLHLGR
jgi:hypothetical protein